MKISTRGEYGVRAMVELALNQDKGAVTVKEIARRQGISDKYLEHLFSLLKKGGFVHSLRGAQGGYRLAKNPEEITLGDLIRALEGPIQLVDCFQMSDQGGCRQAGNCVLQEVWEDVNGAIDAALDGITLESICQRVSKRRQQGYMFYI